MSVLIKKEIEKLSADLNVKLLGNDYTTENFEGCSYDLRIGTIIIDDLNGKTPKKNIISSSTKPNEIIEISPSQIVTILTLEEVNLPLDICGTVFAMNSRSSSGFLILNPGHIDPGYEGAISICAINLSSEKIALRIGDKIFTIIFEQLTDKTTKFKRNRKFQRNDFEFDFYTHKAKKLSPSIFNLIVAEQYIPFLRTQIDEVIKEKVYKFMKTLIWILGSILAIVGGIITLVTFLK